MTPALRALQAPKGCLCGSARQVRLCSGPARLRRGKALFCACCMGITHASAGQVLRSCSFQAGRLAGRVSGQRRHGFRHVSTVMGAASTKTTPGKRPVPQYHSLSVLLSYSQLFKSQASDNPALRRGSIKFMLGKMHRTNTSAITHKASGSRVGLKLLTMCLSKKPRTLPLTWPYRLRSLGVRLDKYRL